MIGFGAAFTDSAGFNLNTLTPDAQKLLLESYFSDKGLEYSTGRVPIASCDFSLKEYSYLDTPNDFELNTFSLTSEDFDYKIPFIKQAQKMAPDGLNLFASSWSAPGWMKTNGKMVGGAPLKGELDGKYYTTWAQYLIRFLEEYRKSGINFWGMTVQNEPSSGLDPDYAWQTMYLSAEMERDFVKQILGPMLRNSSAGKDITLMCMDDQRFLLPTWADTVFADPDASQYIAGVAVHWYEDYITPSHNLLWTHERHPDKFILATEACNGYLPLMHGPILGDWSRADAYAHDIIQDLNNYVAGWTDWNLCLDMEGGPNFAKNFVDAPILVNAEKGEFYKQPMFYIMGHFSKFIKPHSARIGLNIDPNAKLLEGVAVSTMKNQRVLVVNNRDSDVTYRLKIEDAANVGKFLYVDVEPHSIHSIIWNKEQ
uniref:Glucosylceramidase n=1 Tax=Steinernema glaseri TaxID=37863 RepID=A0A1I7YYR4_9BILA